MKRTDVDGGNVGEPAGTEPAAGTQVAPKSTVTLRVFSGDGNPVDMPDVRGERFEQAQATLAGEGFSNIRLRQESTNDPSELGRVLDQSPSPGRSVSADDQITLTVGTPSGSAGGN